MSPTLYKPGRVVPSGDLLVALLRDRDSLARLKSAAKIAAGLPLSFLVPLVFATFLWFASFIWWHAMLSWSMLLLITCVIIVPLLYIFEWRTRGRFFMDAIRKAYGDDDIASYAEWRLRCATAAAVGQLEILLFAPRLTISGMTEVLARRNLGVIHLPHAAGILQTLYTADRALDIPQLLDPQGGMAAFRRVVAFLVHYDWIGVAERGDRAWLLTDARQTIDRRLATVAVR